jgi:hypothetical protein
LQNGLHDRIQSRTSCNRYQIPGKGRCHVAQALLSPAVVVLLEGADRPVRERDASRGYFERLQARPSFARVIGEAEPYFQLFPQET